MDTMSTLSTPLSTQEAAAYYRVSDRTIRRGYGSGSCKGLHLPDPEAQGFRLSIPQESPPFKGVGVRQALR